MKLTFNDNFINFHYTSIRSLSLWHTISVCFPISVALSLSTVLQLNNITPGGSETKMVGRNTRQKRDNKKKTLKTILSAGLSHLRIFYHEKYVNKKIVKTTLLWTSRSVGSAERIWIWNRNLQT